MSTSEARRSDATRNRERLIETARAAFLTDGGAVALEAIARSAGVGIGTLYRHFPTREALVEAVYRAEIEAIEAEAEVLLLGAPAAVALRRWMNRYAQFVVTKVAMQDSLMSVLAARAGGVSEIRARINGTIEKFLAAGRSDGTLRDGIPADDVTLSLASMMLASAKSQDPDQAQRLLDLLMAGLTAGRG